MFTQYNSSEESDVSASFVNPRSTFRVSLNLHRYFKDVRARSYVLVTRNRKVRWLQTRIQKLFSLPGEFCLCTNGHLLPPSEPLGVLSHEDCIEIIPLDEAGPAGAERSHREGVGVETAEPKSRHVNGHVASEPRDETDSSGATERDRGDRGADRVDGSTATPEGSPAVAPHALQLSKRRALALLDAYGADETCSDLTPPPRRARRRVRRRPGRPAPAASPAPPASPDRAEVVRNETKDARAPRLVRSIGAELDTSSISGRLY